MPKLIHWTAQELETLREKYPTTRTADLLPLFPGRHLGQLHSKAGCLGLRKDKETIRTMARERMRDQSHPGRKHQFVPGQTPWNAGIHYQAGGRSKETQFKRGNRSNTWKPIGSERIFKGGYLQRKVTDTGYPPRDWVFVHHIIWREAGNEIPQGYRLVFKDGNMRNITVENLELITFAEHLHRNSVHRYGPEFSKVVQLRGAITRQINKQKENSHV